jgi:hypothetical protein
MCVFDVKNGLDYMAILEIHTHFSIHIFYLLIFISANVLDGNAVLNLQRNAFFPYDYHTTQIIYHKLT